ncbi:cytochrome c oxidase subunit 3 [Methylobacter sp. YRD-M1]|uniref:cytochrome c oxidase subunit 3 n=1 Tax=Methylobacter sp. YRD-M1 TaxID=2911520 RepID=UPI00227AC58A|nr:cytochrome c oxidase subunit 3 [Methylobacter sp. YRD-M1]WAK03941.1 cytochrome c oxidase subunit 3 [Methylobacter sp. YRD-M1]
MNRFSAIDASKLPSYAFSHCVPIWWGIIGLIVVEATVFASLVISFFYLQTNFPTWPPDGTQPPELLKPTLATLVLLASAIPMYWADSSIKEGKTFPLKVGPLISIALALAFLIMKVIEYRDIGFRWDTHAYGSVVWAIVGFHSAHVLALILKTSVVTTLAWQNYFNSKRRIGVTVNGLYWYFVVIIWIPLYMTIYWASHLLQS